MHLVNHDNIDSSAIYDNKHLSKRVGVPLFARNLILALNIKSTGNSNPKPHLANVKQSFRSNLPHDRNWFVPTRYSKTISGTNQQFIKPGSYSAAAGTSQAFSNPPLHPGNQYMNNNAPEHFRNSTVKYAGCRTPTTGDADRKLSRCQSTVPTLQLCVSGTLYKASE